MAIKKAKRSKVQINKLNPAQDALQELTESESKQVVGGECPGDHSNDPPPMRAIIPPPKRYIPSDDPQRYTPYQ